MDSQEILEKAIEKAVAGGWSEDKAHMLRELKYNKAIYWAWVMRSFIYDHDFAKALWETEGEHSLEVIISDKEGQERARKLMAHTGWRYHLKEMVIADDPIEYLGQNI